MPSPDQCDQPAMLVEEGHRLFTLYIEKRKDAGEDAPPLHCSAVGGVHLVGVFDGMGGAGSRLYRGTDDAERTGAYLGARAIREAVSDYAYGDPSRIALSRPALGGLGAAVLGALKRLEAEAIPVSSSSLRGSMVREFPTTASLASVVPDPEDRAVIKCRVVNAGDSRVYCLVDDGLQQLSQDDLKAECDALANLRSDSQLSNMVTASNAFALYWREFEVEVPCAIIACTDGCFGYFKSPLHFEAHLLSCLEKASTWADWGERVRQGLIDVAQDDATMALTVCGLDSPAEFSARLVHRLNWLRDALADIDSQPDEDAVRQQIEQWWALYRDSYEGRKPLAQVNLSVSV